MRTLVRSVSLAVMIALAPGCTCGGGGATDAGMEGMCTPDNSACTQNTECCSSLCSGGMCVVAPSCALLGDPCTSAGECCGGARCAPPPAGGASVCQPNCSTDGAGCTLASECCSLACNGTCGMGPVCAIVGNVCAMNPDCCSYNCAAGTCASGTANCDPIGEACTAANSCCSEFCGGAMGGACGVGEAGCRCVQVTSCAQPGELCADDAACCTGWCDGLGVAGTTVGNCAGLAGHSVAGESCGNPGVSANCASNACLDPGNTGVATCQFLGGCLPREEMCVAAADCCSGICETAETLGDGRVVMRCGGSGCLDPGEVCFTAASANCCPGGGGSTGCEPALAGVNRCFGGESPTCVLPGHSCVNPDGTGGCCGDGSATCCFDPYPAILCTSVGGTSVCCLADGQPCSFADVCCSRICVPDAMGMLRCGTGCLDTNAPCTTNADCCNGMCVNVGGNLVCGTCAANGDPCTTGAECCGGVCSPDATGAMVCGGACTPLGGSCAANAECCNYTDQTCCAQSEFPSCSLRAGVTCMP